MDVSALELLLGIGDPVVYGIVVLPVDFRKHQRNSDVPAMLDKNSSKHMYCKYWKASGGLAELQKRGWRHMLIGLGDKQHRQTVCKLVGYTFDGKRKTKNDQATEVSWPPRYPSFDLSGCGI